MYISRVPNNLLPNSSYSDRIFPSTSKSTSKSPADPRQQSSIQHSNNFFALHMNLSFDRQFGGGCAGTCVYLLKRVG